MLYVMYPNENIFLKNKAYTCMTYCTDSVSVEHCVVNVIHMVMLLNDVTEKLLYITQYVRSY